MNAYLFVSIVLASGALAGLVHGAVNLVAVEPYLDAAIDVETRGLFESGELEDTPAVRAEQAEYRTWQKGGQVLAGVALGMSMGALYGLVFALSRGSLPGGSLRQAMALAGIMWLALYMVPFLKYPAELPGGGGGGDILGRSVLYLSFVAISGLAALGFFRLFRRLRGPARLAAPAGYALVMAATFLAMPGTGGAEQADPSQLAGFRAASVIGVTSFWIAAGAVFGLLWGRFCEGRLLHPGR